MKKKRKDCGWKHWKENIEIFNPFIIWKHQKRESKGEKLVKFHLKIYSNLERNERINKYV